MDSDESQDATSGNDSDNESRHSSGSAISLKKRSSSRDSVDSTKSSRSSRSRSHSKNSEPSRPRTVPDGEDDDNSLQSLQDNSSVAEINVSRGDSSPQASINRVRSSLPDANPDYPASPNSSRSNSPAMQNNHVSHRRDHSLLNNEDSQSVKSDSSRNSKSPDKYSDTSDRSALSRNSREVHKAANLDDGITSDSSSSSNDSDKKENPQAEEISDGDIESEHEKNDAGNQNESRKIKEISGSLAHEDLSDVSDLEDSIDHSDYGTSKPSSDVCELDTVKQESENKAIKTMERTNRNEDAEEQLDFEAEDGECAEPDEKSKEKDERILEQEAGEIDDDSSKKPEKEPEELEEGELSDEEDVRPEEVEPRPVCRFFSRGQCTWGASCRFLHPGVTDKGNYTMFDLVRPVVPGEYGHERLMYGGRADPPPVESAWERGLRTAKEMMRKSIKRKEQDIDFEEKKMNLSLAQEEYDKENGYYAKAPPSPEPRYVNIRHATPVDYPPIRTPTEEYYGRRQVIYEPEYTPVPRERYRTYREVQPHRQPEYYSNKLETEPQVANITKSKRPKREVIVQRTEESRSARGDEWSDPWMRLKSPAGRKSTRKRSYSSGSSYSSSSSSGSSKSSYKSRSRSPNKKRSPRSHRRQVSPSVIVSERKAANERAALMNPPAPRKKAPSPGMMRLGAQNPPAPAKVDQFGRTRSKLAMAAALARVKGRTRSSRSSSASSSGSSSSESDSSGSSSSSSRNGSPSPRRPSGVDLAMALKAKAMDALKSGTEKRQIKLNLKNSVSTKKPEFADISRKTESSQGRKRLASSPPAADPKSIANKKASSRREELLKQLKAVEDAIAKKRSKVI